MKITDFVNKKFVIYTFFLYIIKKLYRWQIIAYQ